MANYFGAKYNLENEIKKHLFIISPNNSGSTYLLNVLATSAQTWNLNREGQHIFGFKGVPETNLSWASTKANVDILKDPSIYNWDHTQKAWYFQAFSKTRTAAVFVTKSPPFLVIADMLKANFRNACFIFLVRNPYAVVEGIYRRNRRSNQSDKEKLTEAAKHIMTCFEYQKNNIQAYANDLFITYEQMCNDHAHSQNRIKKFIPELSDLKLKQKIVVKRLYFEALRDMNKQQIDRLSNKNIKDINYVFKENYALMDYFGYELLEAN